MKPGDEKIYACGRWAQHHLHPHTTTPHPSTHLLAMPPIDRPIVLHEATGDFLSPNPSTTTRTAFTNFFLNFRAAPDAHELYKHLFDVHQTIIRLLVDHPAMRSNLEQTFSTPTNSKNKVYFM